MKNSLKGILIAAAAVVTAIVLALAFFYSRNGTEGFKEAISSFVESKNDDSKGSYEAYNNVVVSGESVLKCIDDYEGIKLLEITVNSDTVGTQTYTIDKNGIMTNEGTVLQKDDLFDEFGEYYINPDGQFNATLIQNDSAEVLGIRFNQVNTKVSSADIDDDDYVGDPDIIANAKIIACEVVQEPKYYILCTKANFNMTGLKVKVLYDNGKSIIYGDKTLAAGGVGSTSFEFFGYTQIPKEEIADNEYIKQTIRLQASANNSRAECQFNITIVKPIVIHLEADNDKCVEKDSCIVNTTPVEAPNGVPTKAVNMCSGHKFNIKANYNMGTSSSRDYCTFSGAPTKNYVPNLVSSYYQVDNSPQVAGSVNENRVFTLIVCREKTGEKFAINDITFFKYDVKNIRNNTTDAEADVDANRFLNGDEMEVITSSASDIEFSGTTSNQKITGGGTTLNHYVYNLNLKNDVDTDFNFKMTDIVSGREIVWNGSKDSGNISTNALCKIYKTLIDREFVLKIPTSSSATLRNITLDGKEFALQNKTSTKVTDYITLKTSSGGDFVINSSKGTSVSMCGKKSTSTLANKYVQSIVVYTQFYRRTSDMYLFAFNELNPKLLVKTSNISSSYGSSNAFTGKNNNYVDYKPITDVYSFYGNYFSYKLGDTATTGLLSIDKADPGTYVKKLQERSGTGAFTDAKTTDNSTFSSVNDYYKASNVDSSGDSYYTYHGIISETPITTSAVSGVLPDPEIETLAQSIVTDDVNVTVKPTFYSKINGGSANTPQSVPLFKTNNIDICSVASNLYFDNTGTFACLDSSTSNGTYDFKFGSNGVSRSNIINIARRAAQDSASSIKFTMWDIDNAYGGTPISTKTMKVFYTIDGNTVEGHQTGTTGTKLGYTVIDRPYQFMYNLVGGTVNSNSFYCHTLDYDIYHQDGQAVSYFGDFSGGYFEQKAHPWDNLFVQMVCDSPYGGGDSYNWTINSFYANGSLLSNMSDTNVNNNNGVYFKSISNSASIYYRQQLSTLSNNLNLSIQYNNATFGLQYQVTNPTFGGLGTGYYYRFLEKSNITEGEAIAQITDGISIGNYNKLENNNLFLNVGNGYCATSRGYIGPGIMQVDSPALNTANTYILFYPEYNLRRVAATYISSNTVNVYPESGRGSDTLTIYLGGNQVVANQIGRIYATFDRIPFTDCLKYKMGVFDTFNNFYQSMVTGGDSVSYFSPLFGTLCSVSQSDLVQWYRKNDNDNWVKKSTETNQAYTFTTDKGNDLDKKQFSFIASNGASSYSCDDFHVTLHKPE